MEINVHDRTHHLDPALAEYATAKLSSLPDHFHPIHSAQVEFDSDFKKRRQPQSVVKLTLHLLGHRLPDLRAHAVSSAPRETFDLAFAKLSHELSQLKERVESHS